jgi:pimeloyl-ACP methyl ester carboxylesterase
MRRDRREEGMQSYDIRVDVTGSVDVAGSLQTAATVHLPDRIDGPLTAIFGFPGGAYARGYYDVRMLPGYSQAQHHTDRGIVFVACDHFGLGDSSAVADFDLTVERMAAGNHAATRAVLAGLRAGTLIDGLGPLAIDKVIGIGQSMGGCLVTVQQGTYRSFDAIGVLGYGCAGASFTMPDGSKVKFPAPGRGEAVDAQAAAALDRVAENAAMFAHSFHAPDTAPELLAAESGPDAAKMPWRTAGAPSCAAMMMAEDTIAAEAAMVDVPVLSACGELDIVHDPWSEPAAFASSRDITLLVVRGMRHMHNFAPTRAVLWDRILRFAEDVTPASER